MIDIVEIWSKTVKKFNDDNKCGFCWEFHAPLTNDKANWQQFENPCCVQVMLTDVSISDKPVYHNDFRTADSKCRYKFTLRILLSGKMGTNSFNEIPDHPIDKSLWRSIYFPLLDCLGCEGFLKLCEFDYRLRPKIIGWDRTLEHNYTDENLYGLKINAIIEL